MYRTTLDKLLNIRDEKKTEDGGFTLIELLVVVVIIGILIAIAIPLYLNYEHGAHDKAAESDLREAITAVNQCYSNNNNVYPATSGSGISGGVMTFGTCTVTSAVSSGTSMTYTLDGDGNGFSLTASNSGGTPIYYSYDSENSAGIVSSSTAPAAG